MNRVRILLLCAACVVGGMHLGAWASQKADMSLLQGKSPKEAGLAALVEAERVAGKGSWERIGVGRVYYLSGDKAKGQALFDSVINGKPERSDWQRIGAVYAEAGETAKAEECFLKVLTDPKDDTGASEIGAWYVRTGQREKGEALFAKALARNPGEVWHWVRAAEAYLGVKPE